VADPLARNSEQGDLRSPQIDYYLGLTYEALGKKTIAKSYFTRSSNHAENEISYTRYYQGLSFLKLGNKEKASDIFKQLVTEGEKRINETSDIDFFAKFGEREAENVRLSNAYLLKGLGNKGLGNTDAKTENLKKAVELSASNLFAGIELE
jgi:tetratricopeptide (TPR) repeat protein